MEYTPLNHAKLETRFLRLLERPNDVTTPMQFQLVVHSLSNAPRYYSLSYCWGDDQDQLAAVVDSKNVFLRRNLVEALFNCNLEEGGLIWADAVSIDQSNLHEKNYQIKLMGQIYSQSRRTFVWLGHAHDCTRYAATLLRRCSDILWHDTSTSTWDDAPQEGSNNFEYIFHQALKDHRYAPQALRGLQDLLVRPYWERIWIIQEISKANDVSIHCGRHQFDLQMLLYASTVQTGNVPSHNLKLISTIGRFRMQEQIQKGGGNSRLTLPQAFLETRSSLATDPRDKVYALLGLACDGNDLVPTPTYAEPLDVMFQKLTMAIMGSRLITNTLLISCHVPLPNDTKSPGWGVDWSSISYVPPWMTSYAVRSRDQTAQWKFDPRRLRLHTSARHLGSVGIIGDVYSAPGSFAPPDSYAETGKDVPFQVLEQLSMKILLNFAPHVSASVVGNNGMTNALSRMIRDAQKGSSLYTKHYNLSRLRTTLDALGRIIVKGNPIWHWARENNLRLSRSPQNRLNLYAFRLWESALDGLDGVPESRLQFVTFGDDQLALVSPKTRLGDEIYQIDQCLLPVVLRRTRYDHFTLVGEACLRKHVDGDFYSGRRLVAIQGDRATSRKMIEIILDPSNEDRN